MLYSRRGANSIYGYTQKQTLKMLWEPTIDLNVFTIFNGNDQSDTFFKVCLEKKQNWANTNCFYVPRK